MRYWQGDIWDCLGEGYVVVVPVNLQGYMGRGLAKQAADRFPDLQPQYRAWCATHDAERSDLKELFVWSDGDTDMLVLAPTKRRFQQKSNLGMVEYSLWALSHWPGESNIALPPLGCGFGGLDFQQVHEKSAQWLTSDRFLFVTPNDDVRAKYASSFQSARSGSDGWNW